MVLQCYRLKRRAHSERGDVTFVSYPSVRAREQIVEENFSLDL